MIGPQHPVSQLLHQSKYRSDGESFDDYAVRYARTLADDEKHFRHLLGGLREQRILPAGRQQLAIGRPHQTTAYNCFCGGIIQDSMFGIMTELKNSAMTLRAGGGDGWDFSTIRPEKDPIYGLGPGAFASGPVGFMPLWHAMCSSIMSAGMRRGAMMGSLSCHHPDIMKFIRAKRVSPELTPIFEAIRELPEGPIRKAAEKAAQRLLPLTNFNISVGCTDAFMDAVENDGLYDLTFGGRVYQRVRALDVWAVIMENNWDWAEPGVLFFDRINQMNPLRYCEYILSTNPCSEQPLPPNGACLLGSLNMVKYLVPTYSRILHPHTANGKPPSGEHHSRYVRGYELDIDLFREDIRAAVRAFDNVIENTVYPLPEQEAEAKAKRRMGGGVTGVANALEVCGHVYGTPAYLEAQESILAILRDTAYETSIDLAKEKGSFPLFDADKWLASGFAQTLPEHIRERIKREGLRNGLLLSIAPTGTISLTADNISSGIEPPFALELEREINLAEGRTTVAFNDYAFDRFGVKGRTAMECTPQDHVRVLCSAQKYIDSSISKTCNVNGARGGDVQPGEITFQEFKDLYWLAWKGGAKGCTTYNANGQRAGILTAKAQSGGLRSAAQTSTSVRSGNGETAHDGADTEGTACFLDPTTGIKSCDS